MNKLTKNKYQAFDEKSGFVFKKMQHNINYIFYISKITANC